MEQRVNFPTLTIVTPLNVRTSFSGPNSAMYLLEMIEGGGEGEKGREGERESRGERERGREGERESRGERGTMMWFSSKGNVKQTSQLQ